MSTIRNIVTAAIGVVTTLGLAAPPAAAGTQVTGVYDRYSERAVPRFYYAINVRAPQNSRLTLYYSSRHDHARRFISVRAGSGLGSLDECAKNRGVLPVGQYAVRFWPNYRAGNPAVRGDVWRVSDRVCRNRKTVRNDLFIHSSGAPGAPFRHYRTLGCIKVDQADRARLAAAWRGAWNNSRGQLIVTRRTAR
ncbi:hypothetical protein [Cryptosporangium aurantiacum]|uniref:L,D-transpeptidase catalytic domain n=1 Tax=Cryptosporangium aurantiacum TaxID=134849 RepID=A0A1M7RE96_9ACTN|nr:hypothetical protein [Cryptosporangium aurantiacum]SHN44502.1 hypothetical protein SAMN05443668_110232 [Cryptosporangium aurantiacum]